MVHYNLIQGERFSDERGVLNFFNDFDMGTIVRFYEIAPNNMNTIRAWQGHKKEKKWFYCNAGGFIVNLIKMDNFEKPSSLLIPERVLLDTKNTMILEISGGYATGFKATEENSRLQVFSNFSLDKSKNDDFRYPIETWKAKW